ncbi:hypothetical protein N0V93_008387 [Gnomoniopsis smithogilvyi]|uniref:DUF7908 domain-containing protein n=1 Tax=Gnomoniopsis smithogilvyi TaxID=1191159 RepID=A0A9W8YLL8_9PEZI|nr:hypothetical protein N0V93_008387 [Gnomoniopsis smithogilvyi]
MRAAIFFLLPVLGSCRHLAPRGEVPDPKRQLFNNAVSVCYTYTTTYLTTASLGPSLSGSVPISSLAPGTGTVTQPGVTNTGGLIPTTLPGQTTVPGQSTATPSPVQATTVSAANTIVLSLEAAATGAPATNNTGLRKRQSNLVASGLGYVSAGGTTDTCATAKTFMVGNGQLMDDTTGVFISANTDLQPINLNDAVSESITTDFEIVNGILVWSNSLFYNGAAVFCLLNDFLYATFNEAGPPAGCSIVNLVVVQANVCINVGVSASSSSPPGVSASISAGVSASLSGGVTESASSGQVTPTNSASGGVTESVSSGQVTPTNSASGGVSVSPSVTGPSGSATSIPVPPSSVSAVVPPSSIAASVTSTGPVQTSTPIVINVVQGLYYEIDLAAYLKNDLDVPQPPQTIPTDLSWVGLFSTLIDAVTGLLSYNIHGIVPADYPLGNVVVNVLVDGQASTSYTLNFLLVVTQQTSSLSASLPVPSSTVAAPTTRIPPALSTSSSNLLPTPSAIVITLEQGQTFDVPLTPLLNLFSDLVQSFTTEPVVSWISFGNGGTDLNDLVGTVPVDYPIGNVYVSVSVSGQVQYKLPLIFTIVAGGSSSSTVPTSSPLPTLPSLTVPAASTSAAPATSAVVPPPRTTSVTIFLGQPFDIDLTPLFTSATDFVLEFSSAPVVDWLSLGANPFTLVGTVPAILDVSEVTVFEFVSTASGDLYSIIVTLDIAPFSASSSGAPSSLATTTPIPTGPTTSPPILPSSTIPSAPSTSSTAATSFTTDITLIPGQDFDVDLSQIAESFGAVSLSLSTFSVTPVVSWITTPIEESDGDLHLVGTVPLVDLPGTLVVFIQGQDESGAALNIFVTLVISQVNASSSSAGLVTTTAGISTSTFATSSASSSPSLTPFVIDVPVIAGQTFAIPAAEVISAATGNSVLSFLDVPVTPDFVTTATLAGDLIFTGTAPSDVLPIVPVISFLIQDSTGAVVLINIELVISPATSSSSSSPAALTTSFFPGSQTVTSAASSTSAAVIPVVTLGTLSPGETFFYDASLIISDATGATVTSLEAPVDQPWIDINQIAAPIAGDQTISGTVPDDQALGTYIVAVTALDATTGNRVYFSLALLITAPTASSSIASPSSSSLTGQPLPSSTATPTQSSTASSTTSTTPYATILYLTPGQSFDLNADLLVIANGYFSVGTFTVTPIDAALWLSLTGTVGSQILSGTVPDDYVPGNTVVVDLLSLGLSSITGDVDTYFSVLVELVIVAATPGASSSSQSATGSPTTPAGPSSSTDFTSSSLAPGGTFSSSAIPETSSSATPAASSTIPEASSSVIPNSSSSQGSETSSSAIPEASSTIPEASSSATPESSSSQGLQSSLSPSTTSASSTSTASQSPLPTDFVISPFQDFVLALGPYLHSADDVVSLASAATGFSISGQDLIVSPAAGLEAGLVASVTLNVGGSLGPYTLPFSFFVLPSSFTISPTQNFVLDLTSYLQASTDSPALASPLLGLSIDGDVLTINPVLGLLAGTTITTPIQVLGGGVGDVFTYTLPFTITVLPLSGSSSSTNLASLATSSAPSSVTPSSSFPLTSTASSSTALASQSAAASCQLTGTLPTVAVCDVSVLRYFSLNLGLLPIVNEGGVIQSIVSTTPSVAWLSLDTASQLLVGIPPANSPPTVDVTFSVLLGYLSTIIQIELDVSGALATSSLAASSTAAPSTAAPSTAAPSTAAPQTTAPSASASVALTTTSSFIPQPTPLNCRPATDGLAVAICDVVQLQYFSLPLAAYLPSGSTLTSISAFVDVSLDVNVGTTWLGLGSSVLSGYPPVSALGEYLVALVYTSAGGATNTLLLEINVLGSQSSSSQAATSTAFLSSTATLTTSSASASATIATFLELQGTDVNIDFSTLVPVGDLVAGVSVVDSLGQEVDSLAYDEATNSLVGSIPRTLFGTLKVSIQATTPTGQAVTISAQIIIIPNASSSAAASSTLSPVLPTSSRPFVTSSQGALPTSSSRRPLPSRSTTAVAQSTTSSPAGPSVLAVTIPVISGQINVINVAQYLQSSALDTALALAGSVPQVSWLVLNDLVLLANVPASATGSVSVTLQARYGVVITYDIVLQLVITPPSSLSPSSSSARATSSSPSSSSAIATSSPTPTSSSVPSRSTSSSGVTIITTSSTVYTTSTLGSSTSSRSSRTRSTSSSSTAAAAAPI